MTTEPPRNPYAPSTGGDLEVRAPGALQAILVSAVIGNGTAYTILLLLGLAYAWVLLLTGVPIQELYAREAQSVGFLAFAHVVGFACLVPGGVWSARISPATPSFTAVMAGLLVSIFAISQFLVPYETPVPMWSRVASVVLPIPAFLLGSLWQQRVA